MAAVPQYSYRIVFTDKAGSPALSSTPSWLSARALARRANFGIALDSNDIPVSPRYIDSVLRITGGKMHNTSRWLNQCVILITDSSSVPSLRAKPWVKSVTWTGVFKSGLHREAPGAVNPKAETVGPLAEPGRMKGAGSASYYGASWWQTAMVHGDTLHDQGFRGRGKLIALLDEGYIEADQHYGFDSLRQQGRLLETYNFLLDTSFIYDYDTHGTQSLSTIAGLIPGSYVGTAPDAQFALYLTEDIGFADALYEIDNLVAGMERADSIGADVISASLGYNTFNSPLISGYGHSDLDGRNTIPDKAVSIATQKGMLYVASAGNEGDNSWNYLMTPGDADSALSVGAVNDSGRAAGFSSPGPNASGHVKPDICMKGAPAAVFNTGNGIVSGSGTSFSAPQAAGYAACLMQAFPTLPPAIIHQAFIHIASLYPLSDKKLGYGIPDFRLAQKFLAQFLPDPKADPVRVYPNPFGSSFTLVLPGISAPYSLELVDILGRKLGFTTRLDVTTKGVLLQITPEAAASGMYFLNAIIDGQLHTFKLVRL